MVFSRYRIIHTPWNGTVTTDISEAIDISMDEGIKATTDIFNFSVPAKSGFDNFFDVEDNIKIYFWNDNGSETFVMDGFVDSFKRVETPDRNTWDIKGVNRLERLLNVQVPMNLSNDTAPNMIAGIIDKVNDQNIRDTARSILYTVGPATSASSTIFNTRSDGTSFPNIPTYRRSSATPAYQMIEELGGPKFTGDNRAYFSYLTGDRNFHWRYKVDTPIGNKIIRGNNIKEYDIEKAIFDIINAVIINGGVDFNGAGITDRYYDVTIMARYGPKTRFFHIPSIAEELKLASGALPLGSSFPYGQASKWSGGNAQFRTDVRADIRRKGQSMVQTLGNPRFRMNAKLNGTTSFTKGDPITVEIPGVFVDRNGVRFDSKLLRLEEIEHTFTARGWETNLRLVEDEQTAVGGLL